MDVRRAAALAALGVVVLAAAPAGAEPVERCSYGEAGRVVTAGDTAVSLCASAHLCGGLIVVRVTVNGEEVVRCLDAHVDHWTDQTVCPVFASRGPGVAGVVEIDEEGDVTADGYPAWNCPPYDES